MLFLLQTIARILPLIAGHYFKPFEGLFHRFKQLLYVILTHSVPPEILARGPAACEASPKALSKGKTQVRRVLIGHKRAGKTSLNKSFLGKKFDSKKRSTRGVDIDPSQCKITTEIWKAGESDLSGEDVMDELHVAKVTLKNLKGARSEEEDVHVRDLKREDLSKEEDHNVKKPPAKKLSTQGRRQTSDLAQHSNEIESETGASPKDSMGPDTQVYIYIYIYIH